MRDLVRPRTVRAKIANAARFCVESLEHRVLLSAGDLDPTFGAGGAVLLPNPTGTNGNVVYADAVQADGKILLAGQSLERLNVDGSVDTSFGAGGVVNPSLLANAILVQTDGKIVLGGLESFATGRFALARYRSTARSTSSTSTRFWPITTSPAHGPAGIRPTTGRWMSLTSMPCWRTTT